MIVNDYSDDAKHENECASCEEMKAAFHEFNKLEKSVKEKCRIVRNVNALYPSMRWDLITKAVKKMIMESELEILNVDYHEIGKYLAVMLSENEIAEEGLQLIVPKRNGSRKVTINYLQDRKNDVNWVPGR